MENTSTINTVAKLMSLISLLVALQTSCVKGCVDDNALNYEPEASANNGCIYPDIANLTSVGIKNYPLNDNQGNQWDIDGAADKFIKIFNDETNALMYTTTAEVFTPVTWTLDPLLAFEADEVVLRFELCDQDDSLDVLIDKAILSFKDLTESSTNITEELYPQSLLLEGANGSSFTLNIDWTE